MGIATGGWHLPRFSAIQKILKALDDIKADDARTLAEQKRITEIPASPYKEKVRAIIS